MSFYYPFKSFTVYQFLLSTLEFYCLSVFTIHFGVLLFISFTVHLRVILYISFYYPFKSFTVHQFLLSI